MLSLQRYLEVQARGGSVIHENEWHVAETIEPYHGSSLHFSFGNSAKIALLENLPFATEIIPE